MKLISILKVIIIGIILWMAIKGTIIDIFGIFVDIPVTAQEALVCKEYEQLDFSQYANVSTFAINKRILSRSVRSNYNYVIEREKMELYCIEELKKKDWILYKTRKKANNKKTIIFLKENSYCLMEFSKENAFSVSVYYKGFNKRRNEVY